MFTVIRQYVVGASDEAAVTDLVRSAFGPALRAIPGFLDYTWVKGEGDTMFSVGVYADLAGAEESNRQAAEFVRVQLAGKAIRRIGAMEGEVRFHQEP